VSAVPLSHEFIPGCDFLFVSLTAVCQARIEFSFRKGPTSPAARVSMKAFLIFRPSHGGSSFPSPSIAVRMITAHYHPHSPSFLGVPVSSSFLCALNGSARGVALGPPSFSLSFLATRRSSSSAVTRIQFFNGFFFGFQAHRGIAPVCFVATKTRKTHFPLPGDFFFPCTERHPWLALFVSSTVLRFGSFDGTRSFS